MSILVCNERNQRKGIELNYLCNDSNPIITIIFAHMKTNILFILTVTMLFTSCGNTVGSRAEYAGEDISGIAQIIRDKQTKSASLEMEASGKWKIYSGTSVESIDLSRPLLVGEGSGTFVLQVPDSIRSYFQLVTEKGRAILAERHLPMTGGYNFRDLGGFKTAEGRYVKWGKIIRSDDLYHLTDADLAYLSSLPLISVVDFRAESEVKQAPDKLPETVKGYYPYSISPGNLSASSDFSSLASSKGDTIMMEINKMLVSDSLSINRYRDYFALLQNEANVPLLFHCSAGKDRTGMAAALTLFALGVDEETIMSDYLSSNVYLGDKYKEYVEKYPALKSLFEVKAEYIQAGIQWIKKEYGTVPAYLEQVLGADVQKLKDIYLY